MEKTIKSEPASEPNDRGLRHWVRKHLLCEVPSEFAACEFECSVEECPLERWVNCERRLKRMQFLEGKKEAS
ncbi:MAG: hypothetical protein AAGI48_16230 [Verrucomicrobiota bacterium]